MKYAKGNKPVKEKQISHVLTYMWTVMNKINRRTKQVQRHRYMEQNDRS